MSNLSPLCPIPWQHWLSSLVRLVRVATQCWGHVCQQGATLDWLHQGTNQCTETVLFDSYLLGDEATPCLGPSCREWIGGWCHSGGSWQHWQGCGARLESCVVVQCTCASGCQSPGISRVLDSWEHNAGMLTWKEVTARKWRPLEAYQGVKTHHNIPPGQIRITLMQWFIFFFSAFLSMRRCYRSWLVLLSM